LKQFTHGLHNVLNPLL